MRVGYFGGTFDPPHRGHLAAARAAADTFQLDRVLFAPTGLQPLKDEAPHADFADRLAMTRLLCNADPRFEPSAVDAPRPDGSPNYTVDALAEVRTLFPDAEIFGIAGADSFLSLRRWHDPGRLFTLAEWIVISRPEFDLGNLDPLALSPDQRERVHLLTDVDDDTSSTELRARLRIGVSPADRLTPEVLLYIARMHLYHAVR